MRLPIGIVQLLHGKPHGLHHLPRLFLVGSFGEDGANALGVGQHELIHLILVIPPQPILLGHHRVRDGSVGLADGGLVGGAVIGHADRLTAKDLPTQPRGQHRGVGHVGAVGEVGGAVQDARDLKEMGQVMLAPRGGTGVAHVGHGHTYLHQCLHEGGDRRPVPVGNARGQGADTLGGIHHHIIYCLTEILPADVGRQFPIVEAGELADDIPVPRADHVHGGVLQHIGVGQNGHGGCGRGSDLHTAEDHRRPRRGVAVHGGRGGHDNVRKGVLMTHELAEIVDDTRSHAHNEVYLVGQLPFDGLH